MNERLTRQDIADAQAIIKPHMSATPQLCWPLLCEKLGTEIWVKHENHTPIGAFKVRGGLVYLDRLMRRKNPPGRLITATRGNHGQSIPFSARQYGIEVQVLVPTCNSAEKNRVMRSWGATVDVFGDDFDGAREEAMRRSQTLDGEFVPLFCQDLVKGVSTYAYELMQSLPDLDLIYCPIGTGSAICSLIQVRDLLGRRTGIVGAVSENADAVARSVECGSIVTTETANTFADGVAARMPNAEAFNLIRKGVERIVRVSDGEVAEAIRTIYSCTRNIAEGAGAVSCAAALKESDLVRGKQVAVILTGGNIDKDQLVDVLCGRTPQINS